MPACPSAFAAAVFMSTPMRRTRSPCCARAASGHAAVAPSSDMNSRRLTIEFAHSQASRPVPLEYLTPFTQVGVAKYPRRLDPSNLALRLNARSMSAFGHKLTERDERSPLYPSKRTKRSDVGISALCQKRTNAVQQ